MTLLFNLVPPRYAALVVSAAAVTTGVYNLCRAIGEQAHLQAGSQSAPAPQPSSQTRLLQQILTQLPQLLAQHQSQQELQPEPSARGESDTLDPTYFEPSPQAALENLTQTAEVRA